MTFADTTDTAGYYCPNCGMYVNIWQNHICQWGTNPDYPTPQKECGTPNLDINWGYVPSPFIMRWYICPNCGGGFDEWEEGKCPFCGMKNGEYEKKE